MISHQLVDADPALRPRHGPDEGGQPVVADRRDPLSLRSRSPSAPESLGGRLEGDAVEALERDLLEDGGDVVEGRGGLVGRRFVLSGLFDRGRHDFLASFVHNVYLREPDS